MITVVIRCWMHLNLCVCMDVCARVCEFLADKKKCKKWRVEIFPRYLWGRNSAWMKVTKRTILPETKYSNFGRIPKILPLFFRTSFAESQHVTFCSARVSWNGSCSYFKECCPWNCVCRYRVTLALSLSNPFVDYECVGCVGFFFRFLWKGSTFAYDKEGPSLNGVVSLITSSNQILDLPVIF